MAKVLISFFTPSLKSGIPAFYEGFIKSLIDSGNEVKYLISNHFLDRYWNGSNELKQGVDKNDLVKNIKNFTPDVCFAFNNSIPRDVTDALECPIILWHGDTFDYFNDKEVIKSNCNRYYYVCPFERDVVAIKKEVGPEDKRILKIIPATAVNKKDVNFSQNISFIGSRFNSPDITSILKKIKNPTRLVKIAVAIANNPLVDYEALLKEEDCSDIKKHLTKNDFIAFISAQNRNQTLGSLSDLGLKIYGKGDFFSWIDVNAVLPLLAMCYDDKDVFSLKENQEIYNSSKVSINISHAQAREGFPWRVFDIMASNSCLLSDKRSGLSEFTKGYVNIPMYNDAFEARDLCKKILNDEVYRKEIVEGSQKCIEEKGRWYHRFKEIEEVINVKLTNPPKMKLLNLFNKGEEIKPALLKR